MTPANCLKCKQIFARDTLLQAEMRHTAIKEGEGAAVIELNERLATKHEEHEVTE